MKEIATGNKAIAKAVKQALPAVVAAYPITPQTEIVETIADFVTSGQMKSRYIPVESEHSAMAACIGASITGVRTFTATSAHGLLYMYSRSNRYRCVNRQLRHWTVIVRQLTTRSCDPVTPQFRHDASVVIAQTGQRSGFLNAPASSTSSIRGTKTRVAPQDVQATSARLGVATMCWSAVFRQW